MLLLFRLLIATTSDATNRTKPMIASVFSGGGDIGIVLWFEVYAWVNCLP